MKHWLAALLLLTLLSGLQPPSRTAAACAAAAGAALSRLDDRFAAAQIVVHARLINQSTAAVWAYYKGEGPADLLLVTDGAAVPCDALPAGGAELVLFLTRHDGGGWQLLPYYAAEDASSALLQQLEALSGRAPWLPDPPSAALRSSAEPWPGPFSYLGAALLLIAVLITLRARRARA